MARKSKFDADGEKLAQIGLDPDKMTIRERFEALGGVPEGKDLFELLGMERPTCDAKGTPVSRFAKSYERYDGDTTPIPTDGRFWVGVKAGVYPSKPVRRHSTSCYSPRPLFEADGTLLFECDGMFVVPECETWALQGNGADESVSETKKSDQTQKKLPSESNSAALLGVDPSRNPFSAIKPAKRHQNVPEDTQNTGSTTGLTLFDVLGTSSSAISPARLESVPKSMPSKQNARSKRGLGMSLFTTAVQTDLAL